MSVQKWVSEGACKCRIVASQWIEDCISRGLRLEESGYAVKSDPSRSGPTAAAPTLARTQQQQQPQASGRSGSMQAETAVTAAAAPRRPPSAAPRETSNYPPPQATTITAAAAAAGAAGGTAEEGAGWVGGEEDARVLAWQERMLTQIALHQAIGGPALR